ncbi:MAG: HNH endonuclease [Terriglobia bacterium]
MSNYVLWRRLTETDFNAMYGEASPHGRGGGAMHVALGVRTATFPIDQFLNAPGRSNVTIQTAAELGGEIRAPLTFSSNPNRRGGEWLIRDQFSHRHPAWSSAAGFPLTFDQADPPYVLIFRVGRAFHARFASTSRLIGLGANVVSNEILQESKGIRPAASILLAAFDIPQTLLETFEKQATEDVSEAFDPTNVSDGRQRVFAEILRRLGQQAFRRKLLSAYGTQCAVTLCTTKWVLEAAHITPYRGIKTNAVSNGLLLRADIHTLFDLALISIEPIKVKICVSSLLSGSLYEELDGRTPALPNKAAARPSLAALEEHYRLFHA